MLAAVARLMRSNGELVRQSIVSWMTAEVRTGPSFSRQGSDIGGTMAAHWRSIVRAMGQGGRSGRANSAEVDETDDDTLVAPGDVHRLGLDVARDGGRQPARWAVERLAQPGAEVLDVEQACGACVRNREALPSVHVVDIDVHDRALRLADSTFTEHRLADRVRVRRQVWRR